MKVRELALIGLMAGVMCILGPLSLALPVSPVPISLGSMGVALAAFLLGWKRGTLSVLIYLLLGAVGMPVFTGFSGGIGKVLGPTGGYMLGYLFLALILGFCADRWPGKLWMQIGGAVLGTFVLYLFGTLWLAYQGHMGFGAALAAGVLPFLPGDLAKMAIVFLAGIPIRKQLKKEML